MPRKNNRTKPKLLGKYGKKKTMTSRRDKSNSWESKLLIELKKGKKDIQK